MAFNEDEVERYARHLVLSEIGGPGQQALKRARVLIVGAGGVGAPAALYLAAAGVGTLGLVDDDIVALSNLQRQVLFDTADIGRAKVEAAAARLAALNPHVAVEPFAERITPENAVARVSAFDLVLDGTDDFATRHAVAAACVAAGRPLVSGAWGAGGGRSGCSPAGRAIAAWSRTRRPIRRPAPAWAWWAPWPAWSDRWPRWRRSRSSRARARRWRADC